MAVSYTHLLLSLKKTASEKRKLFINEEVQYLDKIATENSSFTPQFYVTIWDKNVEHLQQRAKEMTEKYRKAGVNAKLLNLKEIVYVLTLYTDPVAALAEQDVDNICLLYTSYSRGEISMKKKTKYITAAIVFVLLSLCNIFVSAIFHKMLIKDNQWLTFAPFIETCKLVFSNMGARSIFLSLIHI